MSSSSPSVNRLSKKPRRATIKDVAQAAGVSYGVVSDILRAETRYSYRPETVEAVRSVAQQLSYQPSRVAQALHSGCTHQIALALPTLHSSFSLQFIRSLDNLLLDSDYDLLIISSHVLDKRDITADGLIQYGWSLEEEKGSALPCVFIGPITDFPAQQNKSDLIRLNLDDGSRAAMRHLLQQGYQRIIYVAPALMLYDEEQRYVAYRDAMQKAKLPLEVISLDIYQEQMIRTKARPQLGAYFAQHGFPDAVFCSNDDIAAAAYYAVRAAGLNIPHDVAVVGCDDIEVAEELTPTLSTIRIPFEEIATCAWMILQQRLHQPDKTTHQETFTAQFIRRDSSYRANSTVD